MPKRTSAVGTAGRPADSNPGLTYLLFRLCRQLLADEDVRWSELSLMRMTDVRSTWCKEKNELGGGNEELSAEPWRSDLI